MLSAPTRNSPPPSWVLPSWSGSAPTETWLSPRNLLLAPSSASVPVPRTSPASVRLSAKPSVPPMIVAVPPRLAAPMIVPFPVNVDPAEVSKLRTVTVERSSSSAP